MKDKIILFIIGVLVGAIIATGAFYIYSVVSNKGNDNTPQMGQLPKMPNDGNGQMPEMPNGDMPSIPNMPNDEMPNMPYGERPNMPNGGPSQMPTQPGGRR